MTDGSTWPRLAAMSASPAVPAGASAPQSSQRSLVDIQAELTAAREELVANIAALKAEAAPAAIASRARQGVVNYFRTPQGQVNVKRVAIVGGIVVGVVALKVLTRRR